MTTTMTQTPRTRFRISISGSIATILGWIGSSLTLLFGAIALILALSACSAVPGLQILSFGYLVYVAGQMARAPGLDQLLPGSRTASRVGVWLVAGGIIYLILWVLRGLADDAQLIAPGSIEAARWRRWTATISLVLVVHYTLAILNGGAWSTFLRPIRNIRRLIGRILRPRQTARILREKWTWAWLGRGFELLRLGAFTYVGTMAWIVLPAAMMTLATVSPPARILYLVAVPMLAWIVRLLPVMQVRFATENRIGVFWEVRAAQRLTARVPVMHLLSLLVWLGLSIPFYLVLAEPFPNGLIWLPALAFLVTAIPGYWMMGWSIGWAQRHGEPASRLFRWPCYALTWVVGLAYVLFVFLSPYVSFRGRWALFEQHALLFPILG